MLVEAAASLNCQRYDVALEEVFVNRTARGGGPFCGDVLKFAVGVLVITTFLVIGYEQPD